MKGTGKKVITYVLALILVVSSFNLGDRVMASEAVSSKGQGYDEYYNFESMSEADLDKMGFTATEWVGSTSSKGKVSDFWTITNQGLEPKYDAGKNYWEKIDIAQGSKNFEIVLEYYMGYSLGVTFGKEGVFAGGEAAAVRLYYQQLNLWMEGVATKTVSLAGADVQKNSSGSDYGGIQIKNLDTTSKADQLVKLHVRVIDKSITMWFEGYGAVATMKAASGYVADTIGLIAKKNINVGGFKSLAINRYDVAYDFDNLDLTTLDEAGVTSVKLPSGNIAGREDEVMASEHWFTGQDLYPEGQNVGVKNDALKLKAFTKDNFYLLNLAEEKPEFELTVQMYPVNNGGIVFGKRDEHPEPDPTKKASASVFFGGAAGQMWLEGFNGSSYAVQGAAASVQPASGYASFKIDGMKTELVTLHVKVSEGQVKIWVDEFDAACTATLSNTHEVDTIALHQRDFVGFGIKNVSIDYSPTPEPYQKNFHNADVKKMTEFTSTLLDINKNYAVIEGEENRPVEEHWFTGTSGGGYEVNEEKGYTTGIGSASRWWGLKPLHRNQDKRLALLTHSQQHENFEASYSIRRHGGTYGLVFGKASEYPQNIHDGSVRVMPQVNASGKAYLVVRGAIDANSAVVNDSERNLKKAVGYAQMDITDLYEKQTSDNYPMSTIHVAVKNGKVTVSMADSDVLLTINLAGSYESGSVSLVASGCDNGAFVDFSICDDMPSSQPETAVLGYKMEEKGDYATITLSTDMAYSKLGGAISYDKNLYQYEHVVFLGDSAYANSGCRLEEIDGKVLIDALANSSGDIAMLCFRKLQSTMDFRGFKVESNRNTVTVSGGHSVKNVSHTLRLDKDYHEDLIMNVQDLVEAKKSVPDDSAKLRKILVGAETVSPLIGKTALALGDSIMRGAGDEVELSWPGRLETYGMYCQNIANSGWALTTPETSGRSTIVSQYDVYKNSLQDTYDFVLLEGGVNDVLIMQGSSEYASRLSWGELDTSGSTYNTKTIAGAMQDLVVKTQEKFKEAKIIYVINSYYGASDANMQQFVQLVKAVCDFHGIAYIDLSDTTKYPELIALTPEGHENMNQLYTKYLPDGLHPNAASYDLTTPYIVDVMTGLTSRSQEKEYVYVEAAAASEGNGSAEEPYKKLEYAVNRVKNGGTVEIIGEYVCTEETPNWGVANKQVTICGGTLDISGVEKLYINGPVTLDNLTVKPNASGYIFAGGNRFVVKESVTFEGQLGHMYGGHSSKQVGSTHLVLEAGNYREIFGGSLHVQLNGDTYVYVGGSVNKDIDAWSHDVNNAIYGGGYNSAVTGNTEIVINGAKANYVYGGGWATHAYIGGISKVKMEAGQVMSIYGGSRSATARADETTATEVVMSGGTVEQIFGGSENSNLTGTAYVLLRGGTLTRRVFGGCYNQIENESVYHVVGTARVCIEDINYTHSTGVDRCISACSRSETNYTDETGILEIKTQSLYDSLKRYIGYNDWGYYLAGYDELYVAEEKNV